MERTYLSSACPLPLLMVRQPCLGPSPNVGRADPGPSGRSRGGLDKATLGIIKAVGYGHFKTRRPAAWHSGSADYYGLTQSNFEK